MSHTHNCLGPYFLSLVCETENDLNRIETVYIDGFETEADAWRACRELKGYGAIEAVNASGADTSVDRGDILQVMIAKTSAADFPPGFAVTAA